MYRIAAAVISIIFFVSIPALAELDEIQWRQGLDVRALMPLGSWKRQFEITEGKDRGRIVPLTLQRDSLTAGRWKLSFGDYAGILMQNDAHRGLLLERLNLYKSRSYIVYEPALAIFAVDATPGSTGVRQGSFKMFDVETGKLKRSGHVTHQVKQVSRSRFDTPAGRIDGYYVSINHRMDMKYAELDMTLGLGFHDDGPIFGAGEYTLTKLGIFKARNTASAALTQ
ncbi:MAG TPA: hypothetical protein VIE90_00700 [Candidatus Binatia bacterium]|jgi:hypothetical protein